jgi:hypothetical protein
MDSLIDSLLDSLEDIILDSLPYSLLNWVGERVDPLSRLLDVGTGWAIGDCSAYFDPEHRVGTAGPKWLPSNH